MNKILIDTNIYSNALRGHAFEVSLLKTADSILVSCITIGELLTGFKLGKKEAQNKNQLFQFLATPRITICEITPSTADHYSHIMTLLRKQGTPIPTNDIWIGASVMEHGAKLATHDKHFEKIPGIYLVPFS